MREAGYKIDRPNNWTGMLLYFSNCLPKNDAHCAHDAQPLENKDETPGTIRAQSGHEKSGKSFDEKCVSELPPGCQKCFHHVPATCPDGLCAEGYCQQDLKCYDFTEIAKP